ncbi:clathrin interactor 1-like [Prunus dulcis]|uniref:clathrin interactor 1-like n=1 Tax=Prunus dulcis TaxID=3755 RepID=UPI0014829417|nr:clathrin interactor 1-like [Prunus dulcis]
MSSPLFYELKKQASSFLKEKIKTARLTLTNVTPAQLMTEEATNENPCPPDTRTIGVISRAAFEVDDYWRIVEILHKRLLSFNRKNWRGSYKALILLEHLLSHGPLRIAEEFEGDKDIIKEMGRFQYIDEKGYNRITGD